MSNQEMTYSILQEIDALQKTEMLPVSNDHLKHLSNEVNILEYLVTMKNEGLIRGDLVTNSASGAPRRIANIRLTYSGVKALR